MNTELFFNLPFFLSILYLNAKYTVLHAKILSFYSSIALWLKFFEKKKFNLLQDFRFILG